MKKIRLIQAGISTKSYNRVLFYLKRAFVGIEYTSERHASPLNRRRVGRDFYFKTIVMEVFLCEDDYLIM